MKLRKWIPLLVIALLLLPTGQATSQADCGNVYVVQPGDTLAEIAQRCNVSLQDLLAYNPFIDDRNQIYPGWVLDLSSDPQGLSIPETGAPAPSEAFYVVKAGDSLPYIARVLGLNEDDLLEANPQLTQGQELITGQILRLPGRLDHPAAAVSPRVVEPGQQVTLAAAGFPANTPVLIAGGPLGQPGQTLRQLQTNSEGGLRALLAVPHSAERGSRWALVVRSNQDAGLQAVSNLLYVTSTSGPEESVLFTVRTNDTLSGIAARFGVSVDEILAINPQIASASLIRTGQDILIPGRSLREQFEAGQAVLLLEPNAGPPGTEVEVYGRGLPAGAQIDLSVGRASDQRTPLDVREFEVSPRGTIYTTITISDNVNLGEVLVFTADPEQDRGITPPTQLFYVLQTGIPTTGGGGAPQMPAVQLLPNSGLPGSDVQLSADGFAPNIPVRLTVGQGANNPAYTLRLYTNRNGQLRTFLSIPETGDTTTPYSVVLTPLQGGGGQSYQALFQLDQPVIPQTGGGGGGQVVVSPSLSLVPSSGPPGTIFTVDLTNYPANTPITLGIGHSQLQPDYRYQYVTSSDGSFTARVQVPETFGTSEFLSITIELNDARVPVLRDFFDVTSP